MDIKEIIKNIHTQWIIAKEQRRQRCVATGLTDVAQKLHDCDLFKGTEDVAEIARLFKSPQGLEFCLAANFPNLGTLRCFKGMNPEKYGIYIDAGEIKLKNPGTAILIGKTIATVKCDSKTESQTIVAMHGATATVLATGWSVVRTETGIGCNMIRRTADNAIIL